MKTFEVADALEQQATLDLLHQREAELNRILRCVADCLWSATVDAHGRWHWHYCSPVIERLTGRPAHFFDLGLTPWLSIVHPEDWERFSWMISHLQDGQSDCDDEFRILRPDGMIRWIRWSVQTQREAEGIRLDGVLSDLTERRLAQEALEESRRQIQEQNLELTRSEARLRNIVETSNDVLFTINSRGKITAVQGRGLKRVFGFSAEEVLGKSFVQFVDPESLQRDAAIFEEVLHGKPVENFESVYRDKPGERVYARLNAIPLYDDNGQYVGTTGTLADITAIKRAEIRLRESEERFHAFMDNSPVVAFVKDAAGDYVYINRLYRTLFHRTDADVIGQSDLVLWTPEVAAAVRENDRKILASDRTFELLEIVPTPDGVDRHWLVQKFPFRDAAGNVYLGGIALDQTERLQAEQAVRDSEQRYRLLFQRNLAGVFRSSLDGRLLNCNDSLAKMLGFASVEESLQHPTTSYYPNPEDRAAMIRKLRETGVLINFELELKRRDGQPLWVLANVTLMPDAECGEILEGTFFDISERKRMEDAMRSSEAKYRSLIENLDQSIFLKDRTGAYLAANQHFCRVMGVSESDLIGRTDFEFLPRELADRHRNEDRRILLDGRAMESEGPRLCDGKYRDFRYRKSPVLDDRGEIVGILGIVWDVTEQTALEGQVRQMQKMDAIGQMAGGIAHDFNNLLTVILGNLSFALKRKTLPEEVVEMLRCSEQAGMRAAELTQRLLGFSRRSVLRTEPVHLNQSVEETVRLFRRTIDPRIELTTELDSEVWLVKADPGLVNQLLMNLTLNARDAMPEGGKLRLATANFQPSPDYLRRNLEARPGDYVRVRVQDTGIGMPPEIRQRIFEPFFTTKEKGKGTGLGLATVFGIIKQHGGWIECRSEQNVGSTFDVFFPRHSTGVGAKDRNAVRAPPGGAETILLVDDEPMIRNLGNLVLQRFGYQVLLAEDGLQAVQIYTQKSNDIDLIILDGTMPRMNGKDALREFIRIEPKVKVLYSTGYSVENLHLNDFPQVVGFMHKPYRVDDLAATIRSVLDRGEE